jgi:hypothetical protein
MLIWVEHIGYIVKFPGVDDKDTSMTLAMNRLNISSPRSAKKRPNNLYTPYTPSKRRYSSDPTSVRPSQLSQAETVPVRPRLTSSTEGNDVSLKPWGILVSKTSGKPDIGLVTGSTGIGKLCPDVDVMTGERELDYSTPTSL